MVVQSSEPAENMTTARRKSAASSGTTWSDKEIKTLMGEQKIGAVRNRAVF